MIEKNNFVYIFFVIKYFRFSDFSLFFCQNCHAPPLPPQKRSPPPLSQQPLKIEILLSPLFFLKILRLKPPLPPPAHYNCILWLGWVLPGIPLEQSDSRYLWSSISLEGINWCLCLTIVKLIHLFSFICFFACFIRYSGSPLVITS